MLKFVGLGALLSATVLTLACSAERNNAGEIVTGGALDAFSIKVGDCYDDRTLNDDEVTDVSGTPCAGPHDNEVFALFDITSDEFPGEDIMESLANSGCAERFQAYVGATYEESVLAITHLTPSAASWREADDREVVCVAYHMELDKLEGSVRDSGM